MFVQADISHLPNHPAIIVPGEVPDSIETDLLFDLTERGGLAHADVRGGFDTRRVIAVPF